MRSRNDYDRALAVVREVILEWDPYRLIAEGAPPDEWDHEIASIASIAAQIPRINSPDDAAHAISRVFSASLRPEGFTPSDCADVGRRLYAALARSGILTPGE